MPTVQIDPRFHGPPHSANGGYACGLVAGLTPTSVAVSLRVPPPLGRPLDATVDADGAVAVHDGSTLVADAVPTAVAPTVPPRTVGLADAEAAAERFAGFDEHPFPTCWVCGPDRVAGDGLCLFPGPVDDAPAASGLVAAPWTPAPEVADGQGHVRPEHVWAALDCPSYFGAVGAEPALLARLAADLTAPVPVGRPHVVVGWAADTPDGRKRHGASAVLDPDGRVLASARALWVTLSPDALADLLEPA